jgi:lipid II:glycine glycyltransferase (peptidoglycan interpeptide bridge formation enzyme)
MAEITVKTIDEENLWEDFLLTHPERSFLQSWYWGEFHQNFGNKIHRSGFSDNGKLVGVMLSVVEDAKRGRYLTVPGGPIIDWNDKDVVASFVLEIKKIAAIESCIFVRVRPQLELNEFSKNIFKDQGFVFAPVHLHAELTTQLDITKSEDELLANMRKATRYEIKKGTTQEIQVTTTDDPQAIDKFYDLQIQTSERHKFVPFSRKFLTEQFKIFAKAKKALLYTAEFEGKLLAQAFIIFYGEEAAYHYGASTEDGRKYPGAYLVQWAAIKEAKKRGLKRYNFWGVAAETEKNHRFYGLSIFKRGFGGTEFEYLHAQDLVINRQRYLINLIIEKIRKKIRHI